MGDKVKNASIPLLESSSTGTASKFQTLGNIIVSVVGTGILGLPFAFRIAGWLAGSLGVIIAGIATFYCMLLLVQCKEKLASQELTPETETYGDLGYKCMGNTGRYLTEFLIFTSQCGGAVAYLVFIGQNLSSVFKGHGISSSSFIFLLVPIEIALSWINSLSSLAPFSIFADTCNVLAMAIVVKEDVDKVISGEFRFSERKAITSSIGGLPFAGGMAVFCFEGFGMTLSLEASMKERGGFSSLLASALTGITLVYVLFGFSGYMAYGDETKDIITLNLPHNWSTIAVQVMCSRLSAICLPYLSTLSLSSIIVIRYPSPVGTDCLFASNFYQNPYGRHRSTCISMYLYTVKLCYLACVPTYKLWDIRLNNCKGCHGHANLCANWQQVGLCLGLAFTFPIMAHPIHEIVEGKLKNSEWFRTVCYKDGENPTLVGKFGRYLSRATLIVVLAFLASFVPGFGEFASLVGSTLCALISFVLPATFHLKLLGPSLRLWQKALDYIFLIGGLLFAAYGTWSSIVGF
ncbi:unnamed protein product [Dovyalis caffra]|uniref:Amino acid transporter transmembrane domain-containing protein n=1 Tax=Dovyalis caffra TaxID=77055 RepID=A0AAV1RYT4_9ROSI|nr:unnamed protein product [Dovyalis caffra]